MEIHVKAFLNSLLLSILIIPLCSIAGTPPVIPTEDIQFDWVQFDSDEILKGEIISIYDETLEFDSEELGIISLDMGDVKILRSTRAMTVGIRKQKPITGQVFINDNSVTVGGIRFPRADLLTIVSLRENEFDNWGTKINFGLNTRTGNRESTDFTTVAKVGRRTAKSRFVVDYLGNYSSNGDTSLSNNHRTNLGFDIFISKRFFIRPLFAEYLRDPFKNINHKVTAGFGIGYDILDAYGITWNVNGGPAYILNTYESVQNDREEEVETAAGVLATEYDWDITANIEFYGSYRLQYTGETYESYNHHAVNGLSFEFTDLLNLDFQIVWDKIVDPEPDDEGNQPKEDDYQFIMSVGVDF